MQYYEKDWKRNDAFQSQDSLVRWLRRVTLHNRKRYDSAADQPEIEVYHDSTFSFTTLRLLRFSDVQYNSTLVCLRKAIETFAKQEL